MSITDDNDTMSMNEAALHTALNLLRDSDETGRMPSGLALEPDAREMHERATSHFEELLRQVQAGKDQ